MIISVLIYLKSVFTLNKYLSMRNTSMYFTVFFFFIKLSFGKYTHTFCQELAP